MPANNPGAYAQPTDDEIRKRKRARDGAPAYTREFNEQADRDVGVGRLAEGEYLDQARAFDADEAVGRSARAGFETFREDLAEDLTDLRGGQVGAGRIDTGFRFDDEDELIEGGLRDLNRQIAGQSVQAAGLNLRNQEGIGRFGQETTGRYLDILGSNRDESIRQEEVRRQDAAAKRKGMFGLAGRVGGALLGPAGATLGSRLGDSLDSLLS